MSKDNVLDFANAGKTVTSATGAQVYHQPDDVALPPAPSPPPVPPPLPPPAASAPLPIDAALAQSRAIVAAAKFTRKVDKKDPTCETIEIRRKSVRPIGEPGAVITMTGDEAIMQLTGFCVGFLQAIGFLPAPVEDDDYVDDGPDDGGPS